MNHDEGTHHSITLKGDNVAYVVIRGDGDAEMARQFVKDAEKVFTQAKRFPVHGLIDMRTSGLSDYPGIGIYREFLRDDRLGTLVFVNSNSAIETLVRMAVRGRMKPVHFVDSIEEAKKILDIV